MVKLLLGWDILPGKEGEHFDFFVQEFEPGLLELGLHTAEVWYTAYGDWPQIVVGVVAEDLETMEQVLASEQWHQLRASLLKHAIHYRQKVIPASGGYQL